MYLPRGVEHFECDISHHCLSCGLRAPLKHVSSGRATAHNFLCPYARSCVLCSSCPPSTCSQIRIRCFAGSCERNLVYVLSKFGAAWYFACSPGQKKFKEGQTAPRRFRSRLVSGCGRMPGKSVGPALLRACARFLAIDSRRAFLRTYNHLSATELLSIWEMCYMKGGR